MVMNNFAVISDFDKTLEQLFLSEFGDPLNFDLSFAIPDKNFTPFSKARSTLCCYLYEINEDRELRNIEPILRRNSNGTIDRLPAPARVKLSYCITAWSSAPTTPSDSPEIEEHALLSLVLRVLLKYPLIPSQILQGSLGSQELLPYTTVILPDTSKSTSDFWSAIGGQLRPSLDYKVTLALPYQDPSTGPMVRAIQTGLTNTAESTKGVPYYTIGGNVRNTNAQPAPIVGAWVRVDETGTTYVTDALGNFVVERVAAGSYTLAVRANGFKDGSISINIPPQPGDSPTYDIVLTPQ